MATGSGSGSGLGCGCGLLDLERRGFENGRHGLGLGRRRLDGLLDFHGLDLGFDQGLDRRLDRNGLGLELGLGRHRLGFRRLDELALEPKSAAGGRHRERAAERSRHARFELRVPVIVQSLARLHHGEQVGEGVDAIEDLTGAIRLELGEGQDRGSRLARLRVTAGERGELRVVLMEDLERAVEHGDRALLRLLECLTARSLAEGGSNRRQERFDVVQALRLRRRRYARRIGDGQGLGA